jgi:hypothetical protein
MDYNKMLRKLTAVMLPLCLISLLLSSCSTKRWSDPLTEEEGFEISSIISKIHDKEKSCPNSLDADAKIFFKSPTSNSGITSYVQLSSPSFVKFIITNPLGMLMYAFSSDGTTFQILDSVSHLHIRGNVRTLAIRKRMPPVLGEGEWFSYITGRLPSYPLKIQAISRDSNDTTAWVQLAHPKIGITDGSKWVHIDTERQELLGYLFLDAKRKTIAEISYGQQRKTGDICQPKEMIYITDLPWGSEIKIELQNIGTETSFKQSAYILPVPADYYKQLQP